MEHYGVDNFYRLEQSSSGKLSTLGDHCIWLGLPYRSDQHQVSRSPVDRFGGYALPRDWNELLQCEDIQVDIPSICGHHYAGLRSQHDLASNCRV